MCGTQSAGKGDKVKLKCVNGWLVGCGAGVVSIVFSSFGFTSSPPF